MDELYTPLEVLDEMIEAGWGDVPQNQIPAAWRTRQPKTPVQPPKKPRSSRRYIWAGRGAHLALEMKGLTR